ncbi:TPA: cell division protein FtsK [Streptococcus suis]|uniref:FtsK/SpoIIIE domain-containing protein n=1 Tax=Streptococcus suis TaxID=1307 RepID=UPI0015554B6B|nr:FtsK/SpoIIIE domain-containing protein [Streptococcus suis]MCQ9277188.1 FtsK/SpoIIIE domain-containing protein [Streptococcus suis]NQL52360.1 cell division protein FtsK [Streptococcus suis]HEL1986514.1 cell division protein FtsK [Streptococcus suis]HEM3275566.1 cell division protein FtsK [Streptococcus suis]HEM4092577.1 cell division protein FtsK [Streptococcus suis]
MRRIIRRVLRWDKQRLKTVKPTLYIPVSYSGIVSKSFYFIFAILILTTILSLRENFISALVGVFFTSIFWLLFRFWRRCQQAYLNGISYNLQYLLVSNKYYESQVINGREEITNYLVLKYRETEKNIEVHAMKYGDKYNDLASKLGSLLSSALSLELGEMTETIKQVTYIFPKFAEKRLTWEDTLGTANLTISEKVGWQFGSPPHVLLAGSTKSGKTVLLENLVAQYLNIGAEIKLLDPKNGELSWLVGKKLEDRLGYKVVYNSPFQIAGALREAVEEMNRRFQVMADNPDAYISKGKVLSWAEVNGNYPLVIVLDEGIAFKTEAETTKEGKQAYQEAMSNLGSLLVKSRQASIEVIVGLQRASSDFIPTYMRQNFGIALLLGSTTADSDSCRMMFSSQDVDYKTCNIGTGYIQIDGVIPQPRYVETPFKSDELDFEEYFDKACDCYWSIRNNDGLSD